MLIIPALQKLRQEDQEFKVSLGYTEILFQKNKKTNKETHTQHTHTHTLPSKTCHMSLVLFGKQWEITSLF
jgi:hypothetical protein